MTYTTAAKTDKPTDWKALWISFGDDLRILSVNILLVKHQLNIDIHPQHHQYLNCNIFCLCATDRATRAVEEMTPNQAHESSPMVWG
jgi:hypothetical protein